MRLNRVIKVVLPLGLLLLLGPQEPVGPVEPPWVQVSGSPAGSRLSRPGNTNNVGNLAPPVAQNANFSRMEDRGATLWMAPLDSGAGTLHALSAVAPDDIWAVGETRANPSQALAVHWDGTQWSTVARIGAGPSQPGWGVMSTRLISRDPLYDNSPENGARLYDVAAIASDNVWAVGEHSVFVDHMGGAICCWVRQVLIAHWDGKSWRAMASPKIEQRYITTERDQGLRYPDGLMDSYVSLRAITAIAPDDIWAVGNDGYERPLALHWDGATWNTVPIPTIISNSLNDVAAVSSNDVWAVGNGSIIHWDGVRWRETFESEDYPHKPFGFQSVSALSPTEVWVVGYNAYLVGSSMSSFIYDGGFIMRWDGKAWVKTPYPYSESCNSSDTCVLRSVFALASDDVWAVGGSFQNPLVLHWNGKVWSANPCPAKGLVEPGRIGRLRDVVAVAPGQIIAVGTGSHGSDRTGLVILRPGTGLCPATPTPQPTFTPLPTNTPYILATPIGTQPIALPAPMRAPNPDPYLGPWAINTVDVPEPVPSSVVPMP